MSKWRSKSPRASARWVLIVLLAIGGQSLAQEESPQQEEKAKIPTREEKLARLRQRVEDFWKARLEGDWNRTFEFHFPPGSDLEEQRAQRAQWLQGKGNIRYHEFQVDDVRLEEDARALVTVSYRWEMINPLFRAKLEKRRWIEDAEKVEHPWRLEKGDWYREVLSLADRMKGGGRTAKPGAGAEDRAAAPAVAFSPFGADHLPSKGMWRGNPAVADLNADGFDDIVCSIRRGEGLCVFLGDGQGNWKKSIEGISRTLGYGGADVADFDEDGHLDIAFTTHSTPMRVFLGDGSGSNWKELHEDFLAYDRILGDVAAGDLNGDGHVDLVAIDMFSSRDGRGILAFFGNGRGGFELAPPLPLERNKMFGNSVDLGDVDGDGDLDIVASLRNPSVYLNDGEGSFVLHNEGLPTTTTGGSYLNTAVADLVPSRGGAEVVFSAIMKKDAATGEVTQAGLTAWTLGEDGKWQSVSEGLPAADVFYDVDVADFDGDGHLDLVACGYERATTIFLGSGEGRWREVGQIRGTEGARPFLETGDFDGDGRTDVLTVSQYGTGVKVWTREEGELVEDGSPSKR